MRTLTLDSAAEPLVVAVSDGPAVLAVSMLKARPVGGIHLLIQRTLEDLDLVLGDIDRIAVVTGPGSWIGIQAAVTTAKTLAQVAEIPIVPLSRLDALAWSHLRCGTAVVALIDAGNDFAYGRTYWCDTEGVPERMGEPGKFEVQQVVEQLVDCESPIALVGSGAVAYGERVRELLGPAHEVSVASFCSPHVEALVHLATAQAGEAVMGANAYRVDPAYLLGDRDALREYKS